MDNTYKIALQLVYYNKTKFRLRLNGQSEVKWTKRIKPEPINGWQSNNPLDIWIDEYNIGSVAHFSNKRLTTASKDFKNLIILTELLNEGKRDRKSFGDSIL